MLAGDVFDFLQVDGYDGFNAGLSEERLESILASSRTAAVIDGLRRLAARPGLAVTVLSGNHDPELLVPAVRRRFEAAIGRPGSVLWADDEPLRASRGEVPAVWGWALGEPGRQVWIVYGDRWDPLNHIDRDRVSAAIREGHEVELPTGSHLVFEVLQKLKPLHGWIDALKPEPAVFLLLLYLDPPGTLAFLKRHYGLTARLFRGQIDAALRRGPVFGPQPASPASGQDLPDVLAGWVASAVLEEAPSSKELLLAELDSRLRGGAVPAPGTLAEHGGMGRALLRAWLGRMRAADRFGRLDGPDAIPESAALYLPEGVAALVAGHTHGARLRPDLQPFYLNTGTWLPVAKIPGGALGGLIDRLEDGPPWPAEPPRTFAEIDWNDGRPRVRLFAADAEGRPREVTVGTH